MNEPSDSVSGKKNLKLLVLAKHTILHKNRFFPHSWRLAFCFCPSPKRMLTLKKLEKMAPERTCFQVFLTSLCINLCTSINL